MMGKIILFGTNHPLQCGSTNTPQSTLDKYRNYIGQLCASHKIKFIAEEMCKDGLAEHQVTNTVAASFESDTIKHEYVDLTCQERMKLKIDDGALSGIAMQLTLNGNASEFRNRLSLLSNQVREGCWVARILDMNLWPTLFICGAEHVNNIED